MGGQPLASGSFVPWLLGGGGWATSPPPPRTPPALPCWPIIHACLGCNLRLVPGPFWVWCPLGEVGRHRGRGSEAI